MDLSLPRVPVSIGELCDKITILEIKAAQFRDEGKREHVLHELRLLREEAEALALPPETDRLLEGLREVNQLLWDAENEVRALEADGQFDNAFIAVARKIHRSNDERAELKRKINDLCGSDIAEQKEYQTPAPRA